MRDVYKTINGYCPEQDKQNSITVRFNIYEQIGGPALTRRLSFSCAYEKEHGCVTCGQTGIGCPIYQQAEC